jgi:hypothetical protein
MSGKRLPRWFSLTICWISLFGNIGTWLTGVAVAVMSPYEKSTGITLCVTAAASFYCTIVLLLKFRGDIAEKTRPAT